jgi:MFS superfamily sulfate permease-like transporter
MSQQTIRADLLAGVTIALILVPQSMAYAQLAGLPVVYGLYASFVPVIVASMWGSSSQLHTGPVAMLSLMSAAAIIPFASPGSANFIELSIMLALMVGILRLALGIFKLGSIVNLLSSPVIVGFTNAAALIIGLSQLSKVIGVPFPRTDSYLADLWRVLEQIPELHWPTLMFAVGAWILIDLLKRKVPSVPGVLAAVVLATVISAFIGYENKVTVTAEQIKDPETLEMINVYADNASKISAFTNDIAELTRNAAELEKQDDIERIREAAGLHAQAEVLDRRLDMLKASNTNLRVDLHEKTLMAVQTEQGFEYFTEDTLPTGQEADSQNWRFSDVTDTRIVLSSGGAVVGNIPEGLPSFEMPTIQTDLILSLLPAALVMALIGFMEATSISKAIASHTGERVNTSKELVGQGLANIAGSFFGSYTVSGSFSRSAVAAKTGAKTGLFAIISAAAVVLVLVFFTAYLYHLPQAVLAVIVMMAVFSLIRLKPLTQAWKADRVSATIGIVTFFATLLMAPSIANGILLGVVLTVLHYLVRIMKPRADIVGRKADGTIGGIKTHGLESISENFVPVRFDGSLTFINVAYFEDIILEARSKYPHARAILVIGSGINEIDASGEEKVREIAERLCEDGVELIFSGLKHQVKSVLEHCGIVDSLGPDAFYKDKEAALEALLERFGTDPDALKDVPRTKCHEYGR